MGLALVFTYNPEYFSVEFPDKIFGSPFKSVSMIVVAIIYRIVMIGIAPGPLLVSVVVEYMGDGFDPVGV
jgi:hypothetical protein